MLRNHRSKTHCPTALGHLGRDGAVHHGARAGRVDTGVKWINPMRGLVQTIRQPKAPTIGGAAVLIEAAISIILLDRLTGGMIEFGWVDLRSFTPARAPAPQRRRMSGNRMGRLRDKHVGDERGQ